MMARLYLAGTVILLDAVAGRGDVSAADFDRRWVAGLRAQPRDHLAEDAPAISLDGAAGCRRELPRRAAYSLRLLLDLVATFLDTLEAEYVLFVTYKDGGSAFSLPAALLR